MQQAELFDINTLDEMAEAVTQWTGNMVSRMNHYANVPTGMSVTINGQDRILEGDLLDGFVAAMQLAANEITSNPPFVTETDD
jgi:hypothetical protein